MRKGTMLVLRSVNMESYVAFAKIYDQLINEDINYGQWSDCVLELCKQADIKMDKYLDVGCGTGNLTVLLAPHFKSVWGVDLSEDMLFQAGEKLRNQRMKASFVCQDMTMLNLNRKFNLVTSCLDATNYLLEEEQLAEYFTAVYKHLEDDGIFVFDINSYYKLSTIIGNNTFAYSGEDVAYIWENNFEDDIVDMLVTFFEKDGSGFKRFFEDHRERAYKEEDIERVLEERGFIVKGKLDNYKDSVKKTTERITYIVTKNNIGGIINE